MKTSFVNGSNPPQVHARERHVWKQTAYHVPEKALVRELWNLRLRFLKLKPSVLPEDDFIAFRKYLVDPRTTTYVTRAQGGKLGGFYCLRRERFGKAMVFGVEYLIFERSARHLRRFILTFILTYVQAWPNVLLGRSIYFASVNYPSAYRFILVRTGHQMLTSKTVTDDAQCKVLEAFCRAQGNYDEDSRLCTLRTLPPPTIEAFPGLDEYERMNPNWRQGIGLPILYPMKWPLFVHLLLGALTRYRPRSA